VFGYELREATVLAAAGRGCERVALRNRNGSGHSSVHLWRRGHGHRALLPPGCAFCAPSCALSQLATLALGPLAPLALLSTWSPTQGDNHFAGQSSKLAGMLQ
jgi:hypothetical protein